MRFVMQRLKALAILASGILLVSCSDLFSRDCAGVGLPAVSVTVLDGVTGLGAAAGATLILSSHACSDTVTGRTDTQVLSGCTDYEGNYVVTVRKPGYRDWIQSVVQVRDTCSLETKRFTARLERSP
jgi:hypothetical protein